MQVRQSAQREFLLPAEGATHAGPVADVAVAVRTHGLYSYAVPPGLQSQVRAGVRVQCPYGRTDRLVDGVCVRTSDREWDQSRKSLAAVADGPPLLTPPLVELGLWVSQYYGHPPGATLLGLIATPKQSRPRTARRAGPRSQPAADERLETVAGDEPADSFNLTAGQAAALESISAAMQLEQRFGVHVLFGVPGSGKTEVYVRAIRAAIALGRQAILLVPEIALATQMVDRLARRFRRVVVLHSRMTPKQRFEALSEIAAGAADVVIGTRSAVFAPCPRLGVLLVDEEQESSFKNLAAPYYHARDVAIMRGRIENVPVVLGSATPALETWHNTHSQPHFQLLRLPDRAPGAQLPETRLVATPGRDRSDGRLLSPLLTAELKQTLAAGRQAILLHNRRGYAALLRCARCGQAVPCVNCGGHMVFHRGVDDRPAELRCHRCGVSGPARATCVDDSCGGKLEQVGLAIQRLEEELRGVVPAARVLRLDRDTMRKRGDYANALRRFEAHAADVLLGTQMIAKGLDFPLVRLVGVVDADAALWLPDFRAPERVFQLLVQVVGRAGRREGESLAIVQCSDPTAPAVRHALRLDYEAFAAEELAVRQSSFLPPFARLIRFVCADAQPARARAAAAELAAGLRRVAGRVHAGVRVDDAEPCIIARLRTLYRQQVRVRIPRTLDPARILSAAAGEKLLHPRVARFSVDVDALDVF